MGSAFIHSIVCQSTAQTAPHTNKSEHVCGFHSPQWKLPLEARLLSPQQSTLLVYASHIPSLGREKMPEGLRRLKWPPVPEERQTHSVPRPPSLQRDQILRQARDSFDRAAVGMTRLVGPGRVGTAPGHTCWIWWRLGVKNGYPKKPINLGKVCEPKIWVWR